MFQFMVEKIFTECYPVNGISSFDHKERRKMMKPYSIEVTADSLNDARDKAGNLIPQNFRIISEEIINDGKPTVVRKVDARYDNAQEKAMAEVPEGCKITSVKELQTAGMKTVRVAADNADAARKTIEKQFDDTAGITGISLAVPGKKGILGIGKILNLYDVTLMQASVIELTYSAPIKVSFTVTDAKIASWPELCSALKNESVSSAPDFFSTYGYHILFMMLCNRMDQPAYFKEIPFIPVTPDIVKKARQYVEHPAELTQWGLFFPEVRYKIASNNVARASIYEIDMRILETSDWLRKAGKASINSQEVPEVTFAVLMHFLQMPVVYFFFSLPYLDSNISAMGRGKQLVMVKEEAQITAYKGIDTLLLQMFDELGPGESITDENVKTRVLQMLK